MAAIDDAKTIINILKGGNATNAQVLRIADAFIEYAGSAFAPANPNAPTNEEKAQLFLSVMREQARGILNTQARASFRRSAAAQEEAAVNTALNDF